MKNNFFVWVLTPIVFSFSGCIGHLLTKDVKTDPVVHQRPAFVDHVLAQNSDKMYEEGRNIFRYDTFGSEKYWGDQLGLHKAIMGEKLGGVGAGLTPKQALKVGLKVDIQKLPRILVAAIQEGAVGLDNPKTTVALLKANAVVGVKGFFDKKGRLSAVGIQCAICHSTVDDSFANGIGHRLDGWPNRDLNIGKIVSLSPNLQPLADATNLSVAKLTEALQKWGPGRYDAELNLDGITSRPDGKTSATLLPAAFGLAGVNLHTYEGWGGVTYWNAYVANNEMHGQGTFYDPRLNDVNKFPLAVKNKSWNIHNDPDLITSKLAALQYYQLSIPAPKPPKNSYDNQAAKRGEKLFNGKAQCMTCHVPPLYTEPGWDMHTAEEVGIDDFQSKRSPDNRYRTTPLKGLFVRAKGGFYHDGRFANLAAVVDHYNETKNLNLTKEEMKDLIEFLKSL
jgi:hypothetical protein